MISTALWNRHGQFSVGNAETYGQTDSFDVVTVFFALHEMPVDAIVRVLDNAMRVSRKRVVICDISPRKVPSKLMLTGEPYLLEYQKNIVALLKNAAAYAYIEEVVPRHVLLCVIES